ncbi:MAG: hypothetical protein ACYCXA_04040 [Actinomycetes bacterium]
MLPADVAFLAVARTTAAALAARLEFTLDDIEDLRIAVDEAVSLVIAATGTISTTGSGERVPAVSCLFTLDATAERLDLRVTAGSTVNEPPPRTSFSWTVLEALTEAADAGVCDGEVWVALTSRRGRVSTATGPAAGPSRVPEE